MTRVDQALLEKADSFAAEIADVLTRTVVDDVTVAARVHLAPEFLVSLGNMKEPLVRFDYVRDRGFAPAHINVHGESSALGMHFGATGLRELPKLQSLHWPVGGKRYRPCLEDVIEFLIEDLGVPGKSGWRDAIADGRRRWYGHQLGAAVRADQATAVRVLEELGYRVIPP